MRDFFFEDPFFRSSWDNFERVREAMFQESRDMWRRFDDDFRNMACMSNNIMLSDSNVKQESSSMERTSRKEMSSSTSEKRESSMSRSKETMEEGSNKGADSNAVRRRSDFDKDSLSRWESGWMFPRRWMLPSLNAEFDKMDLFKEKDSELIRVKQDNNSLEVSLDTSQYRPDELRVSVNDNMITIEGKHEEKSEDGHKMVARQFSRKYSLPAGARAEDVTSNLASDGVLVVAAGTTPKPAIQVKINQN